MKLNWNKKYTTIAVYIALVLFAATFAVFFLVNNRGMTGGFSKLISALNPLIYGAVIAYLLNPLVNIFDRKLFKKLGEKNKHRLSRALSVTLAMIIFAAFLGLFVSALVPQIISSVSELQSKFSGYTESVKTWLEEKAAASKYLGQALYSAIDYVESFLEKTGELVDIVMPWLGNAATAVLGVIKNALLGIVFAVMLLVSKDRISAVSKKLCHVLLKKEKCEKFLATVKKADNSFGGYIKGTIVDAILVGFVTFFLMWMLGIPYYPLIALVLAVTNMIPIFGPYIGSVPAGFIILIALPSKVIPFAIMVICVQLIDGNIIAPRLIGSNIGLTPEWVIIAITVMSGFFGVAGMLIGVPIFAVFYTLISDWVKKRTGHDDDNAEGSQEKPPDKESKLRTLYNKIFRHNNKTESKE